MQNILIDRERHKVAVQKLNPPIFQYEPIEQPKQMFWMHSIDRSQSPNEGKWLAFVLIAALVVVATVLFYIPSK